MRHQSDLDALLCHLAVRVLALAAMRSLNGHFLCQRKCHLKTGMVQMQHPLYWHPSRSHAAKLTFICLQKREACLQHAKTLGQTFVKIRQQPQVQHISCSCNWLKPLKVVTQADTVAVQHECWICCGHLKRFLPKHMP